jgi:hypothetical protein
MIAAFQIRQNATAPWLELVLTKSGRPIPWEQSFYPCPPVTNEEPIDLTGMNIHAKMFGCGRNQPEHVVLGITEILDPKKGLIVHKWHPEDTADIGFFLLTFVVQDPNMGAILIWPYMRELFTIEVTP